MSGANLTLRKEAYRLAEQLFETKEAGIDFANQLLDVCAKARGKDFLVVHNPGGWGHARLNQCLEWERSIVNGIKTAIEEMGYNLSLTQYFRSGIGWREQMRDLKEQLRFFASKADVMAAWLQFIMAHIKTIKVILVGVSQGAAFGNAVMQRLGGDCPVYSVELGFAFQYRSRRLITEKILVVEGNGLMYDALSQGNLWTGARILMAAPFKWVWHRLRGRQVAFAHCVSAPGHEYNWANPEINGRIKGFLEANFGTRKRAEQLT